jgi:hypothetical protein
MFPFIEILLSNSYTDCDITVIYITLDNWFAVKGILSLLSFFILCIRDNQNVYTILFKIMKFLSLVINFIILVWMILGCIVLYENVNSQIGNKAPIFMYFSIFFGFVSLVNIFFIPKRTIHLLNEPMLVF